jgi:hypothetical protein
LLNAFLGADALAYALNEGEITHMIANAASAKLISTIKPRVASLKVLPPFFFLFPP